MAFTDNIYNVDWNKLVTWLIPYPLRQPKLLAFVDALKQSVADVYTRYLAYKTYTVYWLGINSQVCFMQKALNDKYDIAERRIYITDGVNIEPVLLSLKSENKPQKFSLKTEAQPIRLPLKSEVAAFASDFIVNVPAAVAFSADEMSAVIDSIKTPSKTYIIKIV